MHFSRVYVCAAQVHARRLEIVAFQAVTTYPRQRGGQNTKGARECLCVRENQRAARRDKTQGVSVSRGRDAGESAITLRRFDWIAHAHKHGAQAGRAIAMREPAALPEKLRGELLGQSCMRPSAMVPGGTRTTVNRAVSSPASVPIGRCSATGASGSKPCFTSRSGPPEPLPVPNATRRMPT